jgi:rare lipoprotein A
MIRAHHIFTLTFTIALLLILTLACSSDTPRTNQYTAESEQEIDVNEILQTGTASWYGPGFQGRLTSSRDRFDQNKMTAAHRTLPFNTIIEVVNLENDKSVEVLINDRGPYSRNRIIDLSKAAAEEIDMIDKGTTEVELILVEAGGNIPEDLNRPLYTIQVGEYNRLSYAEKFAGSIGDEVRIEQRFPQGSSRVVYMIYYGIYNSISSARADLIKLNDRGIDGLVRQVN